MDGRGIESESRFPDVSLRTRPNWTAVGFFALLALLHTCVAVSAFAAGRWEGYLSLLFASLFVTVAVTCYHVRRELTVLYDQRVVRVRIGAGRCCCERRVRFSSVRAVRVTLGPRESQDDSSVELLCDGHDDVECPPTPVPRQQGLLLAMMLEVPLVMASEVAPAHPPRTAPVACDSRPG